MSDKEKLIKDKKRVRQHGEVFTPIKIVNDMLNLKGIKEKVEDIRGMVLEPSVGEGVFLVEILKRRLNHLLSLDLDLTEYENMALLSLSTLYGVELLEDNAQKCVMNLYMCFYNYYEKAFIKQNKKPKNKVLSSAKTIISANIAQGNFLTKKTSDGKPIVFSEWKEVNTRKKRKNILVIRTEFTLDEIQKDVIKEGGVTVDSKHEEDDVYQLSLFDFDNDVQLNTKEESNQESIIYRYIECNISDVYKEEMEEYEK